MEEFALDLTLDEAAEARIVHADFLNSIKDWGQRLGMVCSPFSHMCQALSNDPGPEVIKNIVEALPIGISLLIDEINDLYDIIQKEAVKILGAPFVLHTEHSQYCDNTKDNCGHQDHWSEDAE